MSTIPSNPSNTFTPNTGANFNPGRWGVNNAVPQAGVADQARLADGNDLWLPTWSGEVLHAYDQSNMFESMVDTRVLSSGTSVEFPITGTIELTPAWEAGVELSGGGSSSTKFSIGLDKRPTAAHFELDNIDVMIQQFDFRSELARQAGLTLANERDRQIGRLLVKGAQTASRMHIRTGDEGVLAADVSGGTGIDSRYGGSAYYIADSTDVAAWSEDETGALQVLAAIEAEQVRGRELDLPEESLMVVVRPSLFNQIRRLGIASPGVTALTNNSLFNVAGGRDDAKIFGSNTSLPGMTAGLSYLNATIMSSNHLPEADKAYAVGGGAGALEAADANYALSAASGLVGLMFRKGGVASIKKQGMKVDTVNDIRRNSVFTVASMFHGAGVLRPEFCAVLVGATGRPDAAISVLDSEYSNTFAI